MAISVLVVEDDKNIRELLQLYLEKEGYAVTVAADGGQGLTKFRAIQPDLVLLDEPFSNLDPEIRRQMRLLLRQLHQQYRTTILFVTHDLGEAFSLADRMMVLNNGKIEVIGSPAELMENPRSELLEVYLNP
jgi:ABC-type sulfate/molybdate transport systems ATPase subunit